MIRKIGVIGISLFCLALVSSCEKDFNDIGSGVVKNTKFNTNQIDLELKITPKDIENVRADNIGATISEYWLGVYKSGNYKTMEASFVSQLGLPSSLKTSDTKAAEKKDEIDSAFVLDKVILKLPYTATSIGKESDGKPKFRLDSVLGNPNLATNVKVYRNNTFLNALDPGNPTQQNTFLSNHDYSYTEVDLLSEDANFSFIPKAVDTMITITRSYSDGRTFESEEKLISKAPFLAITLDKDKMKTMFWDKFSDPEFANSQVFNEFFKGIVVKAEGTDGVAVPLSFAGTGESASMDFFYTITRTEKKTDDAALTYKDTVPTKFSFPLRGVSNSIYKMSPATVAVPADNFSVQGTAGSSVEIEVLGVNLVKLKQNDPNNTLLKHEDQDADNNGYLDLKELANIRNTNGGEYGLLVNDATLSFYINQTVNTDKNIVPQRLLLHGFTDSKPTHISDSYFESGTYGGNIDVTDNLPEKYTFRITRYISDLLDKSTTNFSPLVLKVYNNPTDNPNKANRVVDVNVKGYNWNPRGVTLLNENESSNGEKRAVLKISYSEKK
ncbi:conserved protein of unknown function [Tenacibaculum sp. 190524A02b]|uniref:DUF4270 domain-containing protein n=1 Tax=Tenacibaculum vairaonense TaxID=3137860 RepID=A0ABP1FEP8_9FLAO